ncbi:MAG: GNAT family N-acetyltransferase [bacterium]|nr:GNAT family N-acetyltransferase [bacterium]
MEIQIKELKQDRLDEFYGLFSHLLHHDFPGYTPAVQQYLLEKVYTRSAFEYWLDHNLKTIFVASVDTVIVGFAIVDEPYGGVSLCRWLGVTEKQRGKGVGTLLIHKWLEHAKLLGCHKAEVAAQPEAVSFYKKVGLEDEGFRKSSYFGIDQTIFGKVLAQPSDLVMTHY